MTRCRKQPCCGRVMVTSPPRPTDSAHHSSWPALLANTFLGVPTHSRQTAGGGITRHRGALAFKRPPQTRKVSHSGRFVPENGTQYALPTNGLICVLSCVFSTRGQLMLSWALTFLIIALIAGALGLFGLQGLAMQVAWILFVVFLVLFLVSLVTGRRTPV